MLLCSIPLMRERGRPYKCTYIYMYIHIGTCYEVNHQEKHFSYKQQMPPTRLGIGGSAQHPVEPLYSLGAYAADFFFHGFFFLPFLASATMALWLCSISSFLLSIDAAAVAYGAKLTFMLICCFGTEHSHSFLSFFLHFPSCRLFFYLATISKVRQSRAMMGVFSPEHMLRRLM